MSNFFNELDQIISDQKELNKKILQVGFFDSKEAEKAQQMEYGGVHFVEELNRSIDVMPRPHMLEFEQQELKNILNTIDIFNLDIDKLGEQCVNAYQSIFEKADSLFQPLTDVGKYIRLLKDQNPNNPVLTGSGDLKNSITYKVKND